MSALLQSGGIGSEQGDQNMSVISSGTVNIMSGVTSTGLEVIQTGIIQVLNGGWAETVSAADGGSVVVSNGGILYQCVLTGGTATVLNGGWAETVFVENGGLYLLSSGASTHDTRISGGGLARIGKDVMATGVTVLDGGVLHVNPAGYARAPVVSSGGTFYVSSAGIVDKARIYGSAFISSGGRINSSTVYSGGHIYVSSGATASKIVENGGYVAVKDGANVTFAPNSFSGLVLSDASATVHSGTTANSATVNAGGRLEVFSGGTVNGVTVNSGGAAEVSSGVISGAVVHADGSLLIYDGTRITGRMVFESGAVVIPFVGSIMDFDLTQTEAGDVALVNDLSILMGTPSYTLTVADAQAEGMYILADGAAKFNSTITVQNTLAETLGTLTVGETLDVDGLDYTLNLTDSVLSITVERPVLPPTNLVGTKDRVSWDPVGTDGYAVEYSTDGFEHCLDVKVSSNAADMLALPAGTYQWRVKSEDGEAWAVGDEIVSDNDNTPKVLQSNADGCDDLFFATANGTWENIYYAQNVGSINDWTGTNEFISANGKGRIQNLFFGSSDPNVLCLTDGENGDALFLDDVYTELPEEIEANTARLLLIQEIRAGAGDDIVDMTSQQFEYTGDGLTIRGGDGNDTIWANKGDNWLFGDAGNDRIVGASGNDVIAGGIGNDRMHGGGGKDTFTFCDNWGVDTVEQLGSGSVTLWFVSGSLDNWNASTLTYTDGDNSVTVKGVTSVELKFGENSPSDVAQFALLFDMGAFDAFTSQRIFEESGLWGIA